MTAFVNTIKYAKIKTKIPHPEDIAFLKKINKYTPKSFHENQLPVVWDKAKDFLVYDRHGNRFLDFTSTIFVTNTGHSNEFVCNAITKQIKDQLLHSYTFPTEIRYKFVKKICEFTGFDKVFLLSAGTEATEAAIKIMRLATKKKNIISFYGSMHGKTSLAENLKHNSDWVTPDKHIYRISFPEPCRHFIDDIKNYYYDKLTDIAGFMIESYRGWDANFFTPFYIQELMKFAKQYKVLVCFDEIQAGFGRTGKLFAYEHYGIKPDLVCCGKGVGGGVPLSLVLGGKHLLDTPNDLSSTHSANPLVCAAGLANIEFIEKNNLIKEAKKKGYYLGFIDKLLYYDIIKEANWCGLVGALVFKTKEIADKVAMAALKRGLLVVHTGRESIKLGPPLTITVDAIIEALTILEESVREVSSEETKW